MSDYNISLIFTVKNEENSIYTLLKSILDQTKIPDEIVIVDGGSTDKTVEIIKEFFNLLPIKLIIKKGVNVPKGRNIAIKNSQYPIIAVTDGGCKLHQDWVYEITRPFKEMDIDVVSGIYIGTGVSYFQQISSQLLIYDFNKIEENSFSPSSRSISFKKSAWEQVNGYPEWLVSAEDTYFNRELRKISKKFYFNKKALVYWEVRKNFSGLFKQNLQYAIYDGIALTELNFYILRFTFWMIFSYTSIISLFYGQIFLIIIISITILVLIRFRIKSKLKNNKLTLKSYFCGLMIYLVFECSKLLGFTIGLLKKVKVYLKKRLKKNFN